MRGVLRTGARWRRCGDIMRRLTPVLYPSGSVDLPTWSAMKALDFDSAWDHAFAVDLTLSQPDPYFIFIGETLVSYDEAFAADFGGACVSDALARSASDMILERRPSIVRVPISAPGVSRIMLRVALAPLSDNGVDLTHLAGFVDTPAPWTSQRLAA